MNGSADQLRVIRSAIGAQRLQALYGQREGMLVNQINRYAHIIKRHNEMFGVEQPLRFFSAPGRTEIGGNHTDHNQGRVLAAAVNLDTVAAVTPTADGVITICSDGYPRMTIDTADLALKEKEKGTSTAVVRGIAARMQALGYPIGGFQAVITSNVLRGSGLSSSAAFEVLICAILDGLYGGMGISPIERAVIAQYAENVYFGKPSGLMDQMASSVGGLVTIDFKHLDKPVVEGIQYDFAARGYGVVVVDTGGDHGDLTADYAAIRAEMEQVAAFFGQKVLRGVGVEQVEGTIPELREQVSDRAILRALHYFDDNKRVLEEVDALKQDDLPRFFGQVIASGESSWKLLQNIWAKPNEQQLALALELSRRMLGGKGAWRVHGGGFAGTILAFVPEALLADYTHRMNAIFGDRAVSVLSIRPVGAVEVNFDA